MFKEVVKKVCDSFLEEARKSPQLLADMAQMEYYMAESYSGRVFVELLQNADDAESIRVLAETDGGNLYFANDGKPFDEDDLVAISRSGSSNKERGKTIGYRGVGFKSASSISNEIVIYSNGAFFTFSRTLCASMLGTDVKNVPAIRVPILINDVPNEIEKHVLQLCEMGYSTVFVFLNANLDIFRDEASSINSGMFLFLNSVNECLLSFGCGEGLKRFSVSRFDDSGNRHVRLSEGERAQEWMLAKRGDVSVAFKVEEGLIVPCDISDAVYHCYLPTLDRAIIPCKINADFSTDPSRKHLTLDERTKKSLDIVADVIVDIMSLAVKNAKSGKYRNLFSMFLNKSTISKSNYYLNDILEGAITGRKWLPLCSGEMVSPKKYKLLPRSFDLENVSLARSVSSPMSKEALSPTVYGGIDGVDEFLSEYSSEEIELETVVDSLSDEDYVGEINPELQVQLTTNVVREAKIRARLNPDRVPNLDGVLLRTVGGGCSSIKAIVSEKKSIDATIREELEERLGDSELEWLESASGLKVKEEPAEKTEKRNGSKGFALPMTAKRVSPHISKWRDAESKCIEIEEILGNRAVDVSLKNVGYDILSTTPEGGKRYLEVKSVKKDFVFSLTNNEYTAAYQYGDDYFLCLMCEDERFLEVRYVQNPLVNASFEKRIRQWEWYCLDFDYSSMTFDL